VSAYHFSAVVPGHDDLFLVNPYGTHSRDHRRHAFLSATSKDNVIDATASRKHGVLYHAGCID